MLLLQYKLYLKIGSHLLICWLHDYLWKFMIKHEPTIVEILNLKIFKLVDKNIKFRVVSMHTIILSIKLTFLEWQLFAYPFLKSTFKLIWAPQPLPSSLICLNSTWKKLKGTNIPLSFSLWCFHALFLSPKKGSYTKGHFMS